MSERINQLINFLFNKPSLTECSTKELQDVTTQHPSFSAGHLLLLKKTDADTPEYTAQYGKAALYAYSPLQLNQWLSDEETTTDFFPAFAEEKIAVPGAAVQPEGLEPLQAKELPATEQREKEITAEVPVEEKMPDEAETIEQPAVIHAAEFSEEEAATEDAATDQLPVEQEAPLAQLTLTNPADAKPLEISFEPYHTVDYFASQGIKLGKVEATNDQLGKQLKSFTEWLKTMKRIPANEISQNGDGVGERKVVNLAAHSLNKTDVVTESMAEVWLKQGNKEKAAEVYNKLSLLNPSKRAYFAAKLESLKKPN